MWIKVVPDATPNADGRWIEVPSVAPVPTSWLAYEAAYAKAIPTGEHPVRFTEHPDIAHPERRDPKREDRSGESMYVTSQRNLYK